MTKFDISLDAIIKKINEQLQLLGTLKKKMAREARFNKYFKNVKEVK